MKFFKKIKESMTCTALYSLPTLHLRFVNGEEMDVKPRLWHLNDGHWSRYYLEDGLVMGRYPLASLIEVYEVSRERKNIKYNFDPLYLPIWISSTYMEGDNLRMERDGWHDVKIFSEENKKGA